MAAIDEAVNSLSPEEIDILNSDPKMLEDFKAKYAPPKQQDGVLNAVGSALKDNLLPNPDTALKPLSGGPTEALGQALSPTEGLTRAGQTINEASNLPSVGIGGLMSLGAGKPLADVSQDVQAGKTTGDVLQDQGAVGKIGGFLTDTALNPLTWLGMEQHVMPEDIKAQMPKVMERINSIPEKATAMEGFNEATPTQQDLEDATQKVTQAYKDAIKEKGDVLNQVKAQAGLPVTIEEKDASIRKFGNKRGLDIGQPLRLADDAPKVFNPDDTIRVPGDPSKNLPDQTLTYRGPATNDPEEWLRGQGFNDDIIKKLKQPIFDTSEAINERPARTTLSAEELQKIGYQVPDVTKGPMPYTITPTKTPEDLNTEIGRFLKNQDYIHDSDRVKASQYFLDKIDNYVDYTKEGDEMQGLLKSKAGQLRENIADAHPALAKAKADFSTRLKSLDLVGDKLDPKEPGATQAYLQRLFTSKSPAAQDDLKQLAKLEEMTGQPVVQNLFKKFAGQAYGEVLPPRHIRTPFQAIESMMTSPRYVATPVMKYGPAALKGVKAGLLGAVEKGIQRPFNTPDMQSLKDRLKNVSQQPGQ